MISVGFTWVATICLYYCCWYNFGCCLFTFCFAFVWVLYRAVYDPDQYLWEKDFTLAGRAYKREDLEASMGINTSSSSFILVFVIVLHYFVIWTLCLASVMKLCSLKMEEAKPWSVVIMFHLFSQKILLFHVLYTVMAIGLSINLMFVFDWGYKIHNW